MLERSRSSRHDGTLESLCKGTVMKMGLGLRYPALAELALVAAGLLIYFLTRGRIAERHQRAHRNAMKLVAWEQRWGLFWEPALNAWVRDQPVCARFWNLIYFWAHAPLIAAGGLWLFRRHRHIYLLTRNAFLVSGVLGLVSYRFFPVAPPRLVPGYGFVDTMRKYSRLSYQAQSLELFVNPYAAVPSLHFGWSFLLSTALVLARPDRAWAWLIAIVQPVLMFISIVATANHWVLDAVAGLAVCLFGLLVAFVQRHLAATRRSTPGTPSLLLEGERGVPGRQG